MPDPAFEKYLALAGVCQAAKLVQDVARTGSADNQALEASLSSILVTEPETPQQVFGSFGNLQKGYQTIVAQLSDLKGGKDTELTRYIASMLTLERRLSKKPSLLDDVATRISHVQRQLAHVDFYNSQIISALASIYSDIVSPLAPKIQVLGNPEFLTQPSNQQKVRALLLAGVRAAVMWRQMGGRRRHIIFNRKDILKNAKQALRHIN